MPLFRRPVVFLPGGGEWDCSRRGRVSRIPRRKFRRYPYSVSRRPFESIFDADPFEHIYVDDYPEESVYDMNDLAASCFGAEPTHLYVYKARTNPNWHNPEDTVKTRQASKTRTVEDSEKDKLTKCKRGNDILMDLDQLVSHFFTSLYDVNNISRSQPKHGMDPAQTNQNQRSKQNKEDSNEESSPTRAPSNSQRQSEIESNNKSNDVIMKNIETEDKTKNNNTSDEGNTIQSKESINEETEQEQRECGDIEVVFVVDDNGYEENEDVCVDDANLMDTQENSTQDNGCEEKTDTDPNEVGDGKTRNPQEDREPKESKDMEKRIAEEVQQLEKFHMTFDLSSFLPEEIQVKLSEDRLILDALHEESKDGSIEKQSIEKMIVLPSGVDTDSLRCCLADDGHMTISANYIRSKESKLLTIERQTV